MITGQFGRIRSEWFANGSCQGQCDLNNHAGTIEGLGLPQGLTHQL